MIDVTQLARPCILNRKEYIPGKPIEEVQREFGISDIVKLASNENPLGASPLAVEAMISELKHNTNRYPESLCHDLAFRLSQKHGLDPDQIFIDNGLDGVITMIGMTFINPGDEVIYGSLTFPAYENIITKMDGKCVPIPMTIDYRIDIEGIISAITPKTKLIFLCNPNNPTGTINTIAEFERLLEAAPENTLLVSDEAYYEFADDDAYPQTIPYLGDYPGLIIMRTFSKIMGLAGMRVGYTLAYRDIIKVMLRSREPFPVNRAAQAGALASLDDSDFVERTLQVTKEGRRQFYDAFEALGLSCYPSQSNFIFVDIGQPAQPVFEALLPEGVIVRPIQSPEAMNCLRITIGTKEENERTILAIKKVLE